MKILWLNPLFPYPLYSGGQVRSFNIIKNLAKKNQITLFSFLRPQREQGPFRELEKICEKVVTFKGRKTWTARNILLSGFSHLPFTITHFYGDHLVEKAIREELNKNKYDLAHFESFYTTPYLKRDLGLPTVLGNENVEYLIYQRFVNTNKIIPLKLMLIYDVLKMRKYEEAAWKRASLNLAVSEVDARIIEKVTHKKCQVIPNGVDIKHFESYQPLKRKGKNPILLFLGDFKYFANHDAINYLLEKIWPRIKHHVPGIQLRLVGKNPGRFIQKIINQDVIIDSGVKDIRQAFSQADLLVVPMRLGSGTSFKVIEAMAAGLPVVTTSVGIEGIKAFRDKEVVVCDDPECFAKEVIKLLGDKKRRETLGESGKALIRKEYDWSKISQKLEDGYQELINEPKKN